MEFLIVGRGKLAKKHFIFQNKEEFEDYFIKEQGSVPPIVYWKQSYNVGDWVLADDGGVCQVLYTKVFKKRGGRRYMRTAVGSFPVTHGMRMDTDVHRRQYPMGRYRFSGDSLGWYKRTERRKFVSKKEKLFTLKVAAGIDPVEAFKACYGDKPDAEKKAWFLIKLDRVMRQIMSDITQIAKEKCGIDHETVLKGILDVAQHGDNDKVKLEAWKELGEIIGTKKREKTTGIIAGGVFRGFTDREIQTAQEAVLIEEPKPVELDKEFTDVLNIVTEKVGKDEPTKVRLEEPKKEEVNK